MFKIRWQKIRILKEIMKKSIWFKVFLGALLLIIGGIAMTYSIENDNYDNLSSTFSTRANGGIVMSPAVAIFFVCILIFVMEVLPIEKIKKFSRKKKILAILIIWFGCVFGTFFVIALTILFQIFVLPKIMMFFS